jgi:hypothetical protein
MNNLIFEIESDVLFTGGDETLPVGCSSGEAFCAVILLMLFIKGADSVIPSLTVSLLFSSIRRSFSLPSTCYHEINLFF